MNNSYITIIKEKRTALSRKRVPLNQNECTDDFRIGVPFEQNLHTLAVCFGGWDKFLQTLLLFMAIDWFTGGILLPAVFGKSPKSENGALESRAG